MSGPYVYLLEAASGEIKIGCSVDPITRWKTIAASSPCFINLVAMWPGSFNEERALHKRFGSLRSYREWFRNEGDLASFVEAKRGQNVPDMPNEIRFCGLSRTQRSEVLRRNQSEKIKAIWADPTRRAEMMRFRSRARSA